MKIKQLLRKLQAAGVEIDRSRGKGGHIGLSYRGRRTVVPVHGSADIGPNFIKTICKQLGLDPAAIK
jgi:predicted RNA binding protein YcfA (HicA-like mRNA interferase family)